MTASIHQTVSELLPLLWTMWFLFLLLTGILILRARRIDPLPLFPLATAGLTLQLGLGLGRIWFGMTFQIMDPVNFPEVWPEIMSPVVLRPLTVIIGGLLAHALLYAFAELRWSSRRRRLTFSTRLAFHSQILLMALAAWIHYRVLDQTVLIQKRNFERILPHTPAAVYHSDTGEPKALFWLVPHNLLYPER